MTASSNEDPPRKASPRPVPKQPVAPPAPDANATSTPPHASRTSPDTTSTPPDASTALPSAPSTAAERPVEKTPPPLTKPLVDVTPPARTAGKHAAEPSIGQLVADASTHLSNLVHSEIELAKLELRSTVKNAGTGAGLFAGAAVVLVFSLTFGFFALAEGIAAAGLQRWLAFLIVFVLQLIVVGLFVYIGIKKVKRVKAPHRTIKTTRETVDYLAKSRR